MVWCGFAWCGVCRGVALCGGVLSQFWGISTHGGQADLGCFLIIVIHSKNKQFLGRLSFHPVSNVLTTCFSRYVSPLAAALKLRFGVCLLCVCINQYFDTPVSKNFGFMSM